MKTILAVEELTMFLASFIALTFFKVDWWWYIILFIAPDISMLGYLAGNKVGAHCYNFFHNKAIAIFLLLLGIMGTGFAEEMYGALSQNMILAGISLFGHSSMDRFFGFGLKTEEGFKFTHLGKIGKDEVASNL